MTTAIPLLRLPWKQKKMACFCFWTQLLNKCTHTETNVYVKPKNAGFLLQYKSQVNDQYKYGLLKTMLDHAFRLSSNTSYFSEECDHLKLLFSTIKYLEKLIDSTIT